VATTKQTTGKRVQSWVPTALHEALNAQAEFERRSISATIRLAVEERARDGRRRGS
jgi:hypothetical protein